MPTVLEIIQKTAGFLAARGVESPRLNAELMIGHALELKRMQLYLQFERVLSEPELVKIRPLVKRRSQREPLQYILGTVDFGGLKLKVDRRALIPRPETELLIEIVVGLCKEKPPRRVLDLGTGSGAMALALAKAFPEVIVTAVERSEEALALAAENAETTGLAARVKLERGAWFDGIAREARFDLIVSNPPYLSESETAEALPEVRDHEPKAALTAGDGGVADLQHIITTAPRFLAEGGMLALETGVLQHAELLRLAGESGLVRAESRRDLTCRDRFILAWKAGGK